MAGSKTRLTEIENQLGQPGAWDNPDKLTPVLKEKSRLEADVSLWEGLLKAKTDLEEWLEMAGEDQSSDVLDSLNEQISLLSSTLEDTEIALLLGQPHDKADAILEIHPGAGGTESQDWAEMLMRMYRRFADSHGFDVEVLDYLQADEAGIKSVTLLLKGTNVFGLLKGESGIHRLIRISPFDSSGRRHTSFASVGVYPDLGQDITIEIKPDELRIDVFRASGPGGQSVNTTDSAVRITHLPSGIVVQSQNEKSQLRNKETALKILKARLYELELQKIEEEKRSQYANKEAIAWGSQIRTYTLQPYRLVKDHRTNTEIGNVDAVLDGDLDTLLRNYLLHFHA